MKIKKEEKQLYGYFKWQTGEITDFQPEGLNAQSAGAAEYVHCISTEG